MHAGVHVFQHPHLVAMTTDEGLKLQQYADCYKLPQRKLVVNA